MHGRRRPGLLGVIGALSMLASVAGCRTTTDSDDAAPSTTSAPIADSTTTSADDGQGDPTTSTDPVDPTSPDPLRPFVAGIDALDAATMARITGVSWREGCPVAPSDLRLVTVSHVDGNGGTTTGELVVAASVAADVVWVFEQLYRAEFPITSMRLVDDFGGDDLASMRADNTSGFNCRYVEGTDRWSRHALGLAVDINPLVNPWVTPSGVSPPEGAAYADRSRALPGMIVAGDVVTSAFATIGWTWGGDWTTSQDHQHFETESSASLPADAGVVVRSVVDGDTFEVDIDGDSESVRLIGINAPESGECFADEATAALTERLARGAVRLTSDVSPRDRFGRLLRTAWVVDQSVNESLVEAGFALAVPFEPDTSSADRLAAAQERAIAAGVGLWAPDACGAVLPGVALSIGALEADAPGDDSVNLNGEYVTIANDGAAAVDLTGWVLKDESASHRFSFPAGFVLEPGTTVTVYTGCGTPGVESLYWCQSGSAVWNNGGDTAFLLDPNGNTVATRRHDG